MVDRHDEFCPLDGWTFEVDSGFWDFGDGVRGWVQLNQPDNVTLGTTSLLALGEYTTRVVTGDGRFGIPHPKTRFHFDNLVQNSAFTDVVNGIEVTENDPTGDFLQPGVTHFMWVRAVVDVPPPQLFIWAPVGPIYVLPRDFVLKAPTGL